MGEKYWTSIHLVVKPLFAMTVSRHFLYEDTGLSQCPGGILAHLSLQTVFKRWSFQGRRLSIFIFSSFHRFSVEIKSGGGDWLVNSYTYCGSLSCWKVNLCLILIVLMDGNKFFSKNILIHDSIHLPFNIWILPVPREEKQPRTIMLSYLHCRFGVFRVMCRANSPLIMMCSVIAKNSLNNSDSKFVCITFTHSSKLSLY